MWTIMDLAAQQTFGTNEESRNIVSGDLVVIRMWQEAHQQFSNAVFSGKEK